MCFVSLNSPPTLSFLVETHYTDLAGSLDQCGEVGGGKVGIEVSLVSSVKYSCNNPLQY